jgi:hypothetical protein
LTALLRECSVVADVDAGRVLRAWCYFEDALIELQPALQPDPREYVNEISRQRANIRGAVLVEVKVLAVRRTAYRCVVLRVPVSIIDGDGTELRPDRLQQFSAKLHGIGHDLRVLSRYAKLGVRKMRRELHRYRPPIAVSYRASLSHIQRCW